MRDLFLRTLGLSILTASSLLAAPLRVGHVEAELLAETSIIRAGQPFAVGLRLRMDDHWHTYWVNPGDSGLPTAITWTLPEGFSAGPIQWPAPVRIPTPPFMTYGYEGEIVLLTEIRPPATLAPGATVELRAAVDWLVCKESCVPGNADLVLTLRIGSDPPRSNAGVTALFVEARRRLAASMPPDWAATFVRSGGDYVVRVTPPAGTSVDAASAYFFPLIEGVIEPAAPQAVALAEGVLTLRLKRASTAGAAADPPELRGVLSATGGFPPELAGRAVELVAAAGPASGAAAVGGASLLLTGLLAFLGGLILNLMPCVFPVLGIKILGFVNQAGAERRKVTLHGLIFTAGVLVSFWAMAGLLIALRAGGAELGWGFQLQSPAFVFALALFLLVFALNLSGVFEVGLSAVGIGSGLQSRTGFTGSFFTGVLATVVATPCSAPFLAPALGAALALPPAASIAVFTAIALGLSLPYLVLSAFPGLVRHLPRPGAWMETFKQFMAFPLYATVGFLVWVLAAQVDEAGFLKTILGLVLVAMAAWAYGRWAQHGDHRSRKLAGTAAAAALLLGGVALGLPSKPAAEWQRWSPGAAEDLSAKGRIVYVDFTARWCATCQTNKALVFSSQAVRDAFRRHDVALLKADWTNRDPAITQALAAFGRSAVPVNLIYAPGRSEPLLLPEVLTPGIVLEALESVAAAPALNRPG